MGIESDKLVYDYLSKVGDLAQTTMPASQRVRLVTELRADIDRARSRSAGDSPAAVRRILGRLGTPDEVVDAAAQSASEPRRPLDASPPARPRTPPPPAAAPEAPAPGAPVDGPRSPGIPAQPGAGERHAPAGGQGPVPPVAEWWRTTPGDSAARTNDLLGGAWTGGLIMSEFEARPVDGVAPAAPADPAVGAVAEAAAQEAWAKDAGRRRRGRLRLPGPFGRRPAPPPPRPAPAEPEAAARWRLPAGPMEILGAVVLVAGAVLGSVVILAGGWLLAYTSRGISRNEAKFAALGVPGIVAVVTLVWFWGRTAGRWGSRMTEAQFTTAFSADVPVLLRVAAVASALFLLWRAVLARR
jgi:hypothetical protein